MPIFSRQQSAAALQHIYDNVFCVKPDSPLVNALTREGINNIADLISMTPDDVDALLYESNEGGSITLRPLSRGLRRLIPLLQEFTERRGAEGNPIGNDWTSVTQEEFDEFRTSPALIGNITGNSPFVRSNPYVTPSPSSSKSTDLALWDRGVKRDPLLFPTLKDEKFNESWHRAMRSQARAQRVEKILDPTYAPTTNDEKELFDRAQAYMYSVLDKVLLTDIGKKIVRKYELTYNAQQVYKEISDHHFKSTKAALVSSDLLTYITGNRLGSDWKGTLGSYIVHWQEQVRLYESLVPSKDHFSDGQKRVMLQNAVNKVQELRRVQTTIEIQKTNTGNDLNYDQYCSLLVSAAQAYDKNQTTSTLRARRTAFMSQLGEPDDSGYYPDSFEPEDDSELYDIDSPISLIYANSAEHSRRHRTLQGVRMTGQQWAALSDKGRQVWDTLTDDDKAVILFGRSSPRNSPRRPSTPSSTPPRPATPRRIHFHETPSPADTDGDVFHDAVETPPATDTETSGTLLINAATTGSALSPGDIRRVLSSNSTRHNDSTPPTTRSASAATTYQANMTIVYSATRQQANQAQSLVDRGANAGIGGTDARVIHKYHRKVTVQGIDNHQVNDVSIGDVGGVVNTQFGPVIAIGCQYALFDSGHTIHSPLQMEAYGMQVDDKSLLLPDGKQRILTPEGYVIPLSIINGLPRLKMRPFTDKEWEELPHIFLTAPPGPIQKEWNPSSMDKTIDDTEEWFDTVMELDPLPEFIGDDFDERGDY